jgi:hypothetical protein
MYVTEDTVRARPDTLRRLFLTAIECGAKRLCLCDTVGHATPTGAANLVRFAQQVVDESGADIGLDWHGHSDRGLAVANTIAAIRAGATRVHGCAIGIGERVGNTPMDQLLVNLQLMGWIDRRSHRAHRVLPQDERGHGACRSRSTTPSSATMRSAPAPACTRRRSSKRSARATAGSPIASIPGCPPRWSGVIRRSRSAR